MFVWAMLFPTGKASPKARLHPIDSRGPRLYPRVTRSLDGGVLPSDSPSGITDLLARWRSGEREALDLLMPLVYEELRTVARHYLRRERPDHTLQSTALVHEAFVRLVGQKPPEWKDRKHFYGVAARLMRQILVDHARAHSAGKRGGDVLKVELTEANAGTKTKGVDILALDESLNRLADLDPQQSQIVELRFFSGLSIEDTSELLGLSPATIKRHWTTARAWLFREMNRKSPE